MERLRPPRSPSSREEAGAALIVASFGGGVNSTAMLIGMWERGERVDLILFADTGGEKPHTYAHVLDMSEWLVAHGLPAIVTVRASLPSDKAGLEDYCLSHGTVPSIAFGYKSCSIQYKARPQDRYLKDMGIVSTSRLVGYDADEPHRAKPFDGYRYPLIEWGWGRDECIEAIDRAGMKQPGKSSCFFCPSTRKRDVMELRRVYPILAARAVAMEKNMNERNPGAVKGLGRSFAWGDLYEADDRQTQMFPETPIEQDCGCYDG